MTYDAVKIPANREEALAALIELNVAKWGEQEREPTRKNRQNDSYGLLLNSLARRPEYDYGDRVPHLVAAAKKALTARDRAELRKGG